MQRSQRGFTLLETAVALAIVTAIGFFVLSSIAAAFRWNTSLAQTRMAETAIGSLSDRLEAEEDSAWAIFSPQLDVYGSSNADGHELDFFLRDTQNRAHFWAYCYDRANHRIQRLLYAQSGGAPLADGAPIAGVDDFFARTYPITALQDPQSPVYSALYRGPSSIRPRFGSILRNHGLPAATRSRTCVCAPRTLRASCSFRRKRRQAASRLCSGIRLHHPARRPATV